MSIEPFNTFSTWILDALFLASWQGGIAAILVWTACSLFPRLPAGARSWLWRLVFVKMLLAFIWVRPVELALLPPIETPASSHQITQVAPIPKAEAPVSSGSQEVPSAIMIELAEDTAALTIENTGVPAEPITAATNSVVPFWSAHWKTLLTSFWSCGVLVGFLLLGRQFHQARSLRRNANRCTAEHVVHPFIALTRAMGLVRLPQIRASTSATRPMLIGIMQPTLIFPEALLGTVSPEALRMMIAHELAHIRRGDLAWTALAAMVRTVFFFHPLVWLARRESLLAQEIACDELAVGVTSSPTTRYAEMLVDVVSLPVSRGPALISLGVAESRKTLQRRIRNMKFIGHKKTKTIQFAAALSMFVALIALIPFRLVAAEAETLEVNAQRDATVPPVEEVTEEITRESRRVDAAKLPPPDTALFERRYTASARRPGRDSIVAPATSLLPGEAARILQEVRGKDRAELRQILPTLTEDTLLIEHLRALSDAEQRNAAIQSDYADEHPEVIRILMVMKTIDSQIENRIDGILAGLKAKARAEAAAEQDLEKSQARENVASSTNRERDPQPERPARPVSVHARVGGSVEKVMVSVGEVVKRGQPLLEIDNSAGRSQLNTAEARAKIAQADLKIARAELEDAQREYERKKQLAEDRLVSGDSLPNLEKFRANLVKAEAQAELAMLERDQAQQDLDRYILLAPRDGTISFIIHEGYWVPESSGKILAEIRTREGERAASQTRARVDSQGQLAALRANLQELRLTHTERSTQVLNLRRRIAVLEKELGQMETTHAPIEVDIDLMKVMLSDLRAKEAELLTKYRSKWPTVVEIQKQIAALESQIRRAETAEGVPDLPQEQLVDPADAKNLDEQRVPEVFVNGSVNKPGAILLADERQLDILGAISRAGGFTQRANRNKIKFTRPGEDERVFSFEDLKNPKNRIPLLPGDIIEVPDKLF